MTDMESAEEDRKSDHSKVHLCHHDEIPFGKASNTKEMTTLLGISAK